MRAQALLLLCGGLLATCAPAPEGAGERTAVRTGIDVLLEEGAGPLTGLRVGLITNHTGRPDVRFR